MNNFKVANPHYSDTSWGIIFQSSVRKVQTQEIEK